MPKLDEQVAAIVAHAYANAPGFKQVLDSAGVKPTEIKGVADLARVPVTSKDRLIEMQQQNPPFGGWVAVPPGKLRRIYLSPGPLYDAQGTTDESSLAAAVEAFKAGGLEPGDVVLNTFLYHLVPAGLLMDEGLHALGAVVVPLGPGNTDLLIKVMMDLRANAYVGTPSFLDIILSKAAQMNIPAGALPLRKAYFSAEPYPASLRQKFEGEFKLRTAQAYATADLGVVAYERIGQPGLYVPESLIVEIADPATGKTLPDGEVGEVVVTTFNQAYPLIRFGTGDLSVMETLQEGGKTVRRLKALVGRSGEAVKVRGMFLHPNQLRAVLGAFPQVKHINAVVGQQGNQDTLTLHVELAEADADQAKFAETLKAAIRDQGRLRVDAVEFVAPGTIDPGGKMVRDERKR